MNQSKPTKQGVREELDQIFGTRGTSQKWQKEQVIALIQAHTQARVSIDDAIELLLKNGYKVSIEYKTLAEEQEGERSDI